MRALLSVSDSTVWRWCRAGKLPPPAYLGGVALWNVGELREAIRFTRDEEHVATTPEAARSSTCHSHAST